MISNSEISATGLIASKGLSGADRYGLFLAGLSMLVYALLSFGFLLSHEYGLYGIDIYDQYYLALLQGRLDMKAITLGYEGHYLKDGTGFLYHGVAPLITRFLFGWAVDFKTTSLAPFSIWLWACIGSAFYHLTFHQVISKFWPQYSSERIWPIILGLMVWFTTPGILIAINGAFYHEVIAIAYAATAIFIYLFSRVYFFDAPLKKVIVPMALMAALAVHARPNLAVGLYMCVVLLCMLSVWHHKQKAFLSVALAMGILGASGFGYIGINALKFGSSSVSHGSFEGGEIQYGTRFWVGESPQNSERAKAFVEHGKFNTKRILPNFVIYSLDPPFYMISKSISENIEAVFQSYIKPSLGFIRIEGPRTGFVYLWLLWLMIVIYALFKRGSPPLPGR